MKERMRRILFPALLISLICTALCIPVLAADSLSGGYVLKQPDAITYLRLTARGVVVVGYLQSLTPDATAPSGYRVSRQDVSGTVSGRSINIPQQGFDLDGTWGSGRVVLDAPAGALVARMTFTRISVEQWNRTVQRFMTVRNLMAEATGIHADYSTQRANYLQASADLPLAHTRLSESVELKRQSLVETDTAVTELAKARQNFDSSKSTARQATDDAQSKAQAAAAISPNDQKAADDAVTAAQEAEKTAEDAEQLTESAEFSVEEAQAKLETNKNDLSAAEAALAQAENAVKRDQETIQTTKLRMSWDSGRYNLLRKQLTAFNPKHR